MYHCQRTEEKMIKHNIHGGNLLISGAGNVVVGFRIINNDRERDTEFEKVTSWKNRNYDKKGK